MTSDRKIKSSACGGASKLASSKPTTGPRSTRNSNGGRSAKRFGSPTAMGGNADDSSKRMKAAEAEEPMEEEDSAVMRMLRAMSDENKSNFNTLRSDLSTFEKRVTRELNAVHSKLSDHDQAILELRDSMHLLAGRVADHEEKLSPDSGDPAEDVAGKLAKLFELCEKDESFVSSKPQYPDTIVIGPAAGGTVTEQSIDQYFKKEMPNAQFTVKKRSDFSDHFLAVFQDKDGKKASEWVNDAKALKFRSVRDMGGWIGQEMDPAVRVFQSSLNGFAARMKRKAVPGQRVEWIIDRGYLVVNNVVIGTPSLLPPHHRWDTVVPKLLQLLDGFAPYYDPTIPPKDQIPEDVALFLLQFRMKPKLAKLQG